MIAVQENGPLSGSQPMHYLLKSRRIGFRCWRDDDFELATRLWGNPEVTAFIGGPFSPEQVQARLANEIALVREYGVQYWPVFLLEADEHIGAAGLRPYRVEEGIYELGVHLRPAFWKRGLATEAARAVMDYAFSKQGAKALFAGHHPGNEASRELLRKLGFAYTHEELYPPTGLMHPSYLFRGR
jgi:RimJ/RimL family protein N-acetyltransferase